MKFTTETDINKPIDKVIELFDNADNMSKWMEGLQSFEHISGTPGQPGAKSKLKFKMGKRDIEMIETITVRNFPDEFSGIYEAKGVNNIVINKFVKVSEEGFMKIIGFLMPNAFKKQSIKYLNDFKKFAENS